MLQCILIENDLPNPLVSVFLLYDNWVRGYGYFYKITTEKQCLLFYSWETLGVGYINVNNYYLFSDRIWATESNGTFVFVLR